MVVIDPHYRGEDEPAFKGFEAEQGSEVFLEASRVGFRLLRRRAEAADNRLEASFSISPLAEFVFSAEVVVPLSST